ncbi:MAG: LPS-assembly protein LptD [Treponemataceae bacterium]
MKKKFVLFAFLFFAFSHLFSQENKKADGAEAAKITRTIIINSANDIEYTKTEPDKKKAEPKKNDETNSDKAETENNKLESITLRGDVSVSVKEGETIDTIIADIIIYNKTRNTLHAQGNVYYERKISGKIEQTFSGKEVIFDIKGMTGVFLNGIIEAASQKTNSPNYIIHSETTGRDASEVIAFKNAKLTTSSAKEPLWSINASRLWMLPGNEMSFANGYYSIGVVPIFYLPFFYHPADEMIFHPVFGFRVREGFFTQTTTYLVGRKKLPPKDKEANLSTFLVPDTLKEQKRNGLFLQNLGSNAKIQNPSYLKIIADAYSSLGYLIGVDGDFGSTVKYFSALNFNAFFAFSHTLYPLTNDNKFFTTYNTSGESKFNKANFFGLSLPFRYNFNFNTTISHSPISLTISTPFVSDPFFKDDFFSRSEDMNWIKFMLNREEAKKDASIQSSYNWLFKLNANPNTGVLSPYLKSFSFSPSLNLYFYNRENENLTGADKVYAPERKFYYPEKLKPEFTTSLSGTIFSTSMLKPKTTSRKITGVKNPFEEEKKKDTNENTKTPPTEENEKPKDATQNNFVYLDRFIPIYKLETKTNKQTKTVNYELGYNFKLNFLNEDIWDYKNWKEPKSIDWKEFSSKYYKLNYDIGLNSSLNIFYNLLKIDNSFKFMQNYQRHPFISDKTKKETFELNNFKANLFSLQNKNSLTLSPFYFSEIFSPTNIQWSISEILLRNKFTGTYLEPKYELEKTKWDKDFIKEHNLSFVFGVNLNSYVQSLKLVAALPPLLSSYTMSSNFQHPFGSLSTNTKVYEKEKAKKKWFWSPFDINANWKLPFGISTSQSYTYNIEEKEHEKFRFYFSWKYISLSFLMQNDLTYKLDSLLGWQAISNKKTFKPKSFEFNFSNTSEPLKFYFWKNRVSVYMSLASTLNINLQKITESFFTFSPSVNFAIHEFLTLKISTVSRNNVIARYFQDNLNLGVTIPGEKNMLKDLAKSFFFWDRQARNESGFKIRSVDIALEHNLKDWTLNFTYSFRPESKYNKTTKRTEFNFVPKITFMVSWNPINNIRVKTKTENKEFQVERSSIR